MMRCLFCENTATVHLTDIVNLKKREVHLCEGCAREHNLLPSPPGPQIDLKALMKLLIAPPLNQGRAELKSAADASCSRCGTSYAAFKAEGRLGCPHDYDVFQPILESLLERVHRSTLHNGKVPARACRTARFDELRTQLKAAVAVEDYEQAARLRDLIRQEEAEGKPG